MSNQGSAFADFKALQLPGRFKCSVCNIFKDETHFSQNELRGAQMKKGLDSFMNGRTANIRCRVCTGTQRQELKCAMCGNTKDFSKFSKSARKSGGTHWCIDCTAFKEVPALEIQQRAATPQEDFASTMVIQGGEPGGQGWDANADNFDKSSMATAPSFTAGRIPDEASTSVAMGNAGLRPSASFPFVQNHVPPHLRVPGGPSPIDDTRSVSSASNLFENMRSSVAPSESGSEWRPVVARQRPSVPFNAWGPNGEQQVRVSSGSSSTAGMGLSNYGTGAYTPVVNPTSTTGRASAWARPENYRPSVQPAMCPPQRHPQNNGEDSDSEFD